MTDILWKPIDRIKDARTGEMVRIRCVEQSGFDWSPEAGTFSWYERDGVYTATADPQGLNEDEGA